MAVIDELEVIDGYFNDDGFYYEGHSWKCCIWHL